MSERISALPCERTGGDLPIVASGHDGILQHSRLRICAKSFWPAAVCYAGLFVPRSIRACSACYGQSDSPMAAGMNWGIVSLLGMVVFVLGGVAGFFIVLARRSNALAKSNAKTPEVSQLDATLPILPEPANDPQPQQLGDRGSFGRVSALAQRRKRCAHSQSEQQGLGAPRGRG